MKLASLSQLLAPLCCSDHGAAPTATVGTVTNDSHKVTPGGIFVAIPGARHNGNDYIAAAVAAGAQTVICDAAGVTPPGVRQITVSDPYGAYSLLAAAEYDFPARHLQSFAVTGTNGKTTTAMVLAQLLNASGLRTGLISTVEYRLGNRVLAAERTTPEAMELQAYFREMVDSGCRAMAMEASSHALAQRRLGDLRPAGVIFTNLTGDHLDYHGSMENYFAAKQRLFTEYPATDGVAVINGDDAWGVRLAAGAATAQTVTFGCAPGVTHRIDAVEIRSDASVFTLGKWRFTTPLIGLHNVYNLAGAILAARYGAGIAWPALQAAVALPTAVPGRLERFALPNGALAFVDYAHTDDALRNVLTLLRTIVKGRLIAVFGAGGDRDRTKRPRMGRVVGTLADAAVITSDNPRSENPEAILHEILAGMPTDIPYQAVADRRTAIEGALTQAGPGDVILIAGKGHETTQEIAGVKTHFDDREVVRQWLATQPALPPRRP